MRKTALVASIAVGGVVLLASCTTQEFRIETYIDAPPSEVWSVLADTAAYPEWNPVFVAIDRPYVEGETVINSVKEPDGRVVEIEATVDRFSPNEELRQSGGITGILTFDHQWLLTAENGGTQVTQYEIDRGVGLWFWDSSWIEPAYASVSQALADRVRQLSGE